MIAGRCRRKRAAERRCGCCKHYRFVPSMTALKSHLPDARKTRFGRRRLAHDRTFRCGMGSLLHFAVGSLTFHLPAPELSAPSRPRHSSAEPPAPGAQRDRVRERPGQSIPFDDWLPARHRCRRESIRRKGYSPSNADRLETSSSRHKQDVDHSHRAERYVRFAGLFPSPLRIMTYRFPNLWDIQP